MRHNGGTQYVSLPCVQCAAIEAELDEPGRDAGIGDAVAPFGDVALSQLIGILRIDPWRQVAEMVGSVISCHGQDVQPTQFRQSSQQKGRAAQIRRGGVDEGAATEFANAPKVGKDDADDVRLIVGRRRPNPLLIGLKIRYSVRAARSDPCRRPR